MGALLFLLTISTIPVIGVWACIQLFRIIMKRTTGADIYISPDGYFHMYRKMKTLWDKDPLAYDADDTPIRRKRKHTPHYDRLIDQQEISKASERLQAPPLQEKTKSAEPVPLAELLENPTQNQAKLD